MKQHMIDLLPDSVRTRSESGMVIGRYITAGVIVVVMLVVLSTHAHFKLGSAEAAFKAAEEKSRQVLAVEAEAKNLREALAGIERTIEQYDRIAPPLNMVDLQALVVSQLPGSVTLERLDFEVLTEAPAFDVRIKETKDAKPTRRVRGELYGFALADSDVAELVSRLGSLKPLTSVDWDYTRSRTVRDQQAREFRMTFKVDLERKYEVQRHGADASNDAHIVSGEVDRHDE